MYLRTALSVAALAADGHPAGDGLVPPLPDRRRMFGGGRVEVTEPLRVGEVATRRSSVAGVRVREGHPDLLVHGPLLAIGAVEAARRGDRRDVRRLDYRLTAPAYPTAPVTFHAAADGPDLTRVAGVQGGEVKVQASMTWRDEDEGDTHA